ncbi:hypothetical protein FHL15_003482 [Xylaria flabelliformis]|uniref:Uncharacterized protein n=1 Tax=Xylaria flabelliformis TaxID=2512241 RepID=A0A553I5T3_9PEZI|nr:hypothetical protein FHL15_003482 [Xylaria flabelliformis]
MAFTKGQSNVNQTRQRVPAGPRPMPRWQIGDIAFLKWADAFSRTERTELLESRRVPTGATGHPVIILASSSDSRYYIVTTVSAYGSGDYNYNLPPWEQSVHMRKNKNAFRAFEGSARPNDRFEPLRLANNKQWPKVETSWVYIYSSYLVPATTLIHYTKSESGLRMEPTSLQDLLGHMEAKCWKFCAQKAEITAKRTPNQPIARSPQQIWRREEKGSVFKLLLLRLNPVDQIGSDAQGPITTITNTASERHKLNDATNAAETKPLTGTVAAKSTKIVARMTSQPKGPSCNGASQNRTTTLPKVDLSQAGHLTVYIP